LAPLWQRLAALVTKEPAPGAVPHIWRFSDMRPNLMEAIDIVAPEEAERRVLVLENPGLTGQSRILDSLFVGLQTIAPDECAPAHRHQASALRFLVEGTSSYTAVNGEKTMMEPGDFVLTPSWSWHDHACVGDHPTIWMDVLDLHIVNMLSGSFREETDEMQQDYPRPNDVSVVEYANGVAPADHKPEHNASPIVNYRYSKVKEVFAAMKAHRDIDPHFGYMVKYLDPLTGDWAMPTIAAHMRRLPKGFESKPYQSTDATIFNVVEGRGESQIGDQTIKWEKGDIFVVPQWAKQIHRADTEATLFSASDRSIQEKARIWREKRHA
jgi:gentisate 1,2-dioxygenase